MTDEKLGLLEHVTYIDKNVLRVLGIDDDILDIKKNNALEKTLEVFDEKKIDILRSHGDKVIDGALISGNEWADIIEGIKNDKELSNLVVLGSEQLETSDHRKFNLNIAYKDKTTNQCIISFKGTSGKEEWQDNVTGLVESDTQAQKEALAFFDKYASKYDDVIVTGHSKGANKAMYVTITSEHANKVSKCVAFDGQGFSNEFLAKYAKQIDANGGKITNYFAKNDFVNVLMKQVENSNQIPCEQYGITTPLQFHSPNSIFVRDEKGNIPVDKEGNKIFSFNELKEKNKHMEKIRDYISYTMDNADKKELIRMSNYLGPLAGELMGVEKNSILKKISVGLKDPVVALKLRKIMGDYAKDNNLTKADFDLVVDQFKVNKKNSVTIDVVKGVGHIADNVFKPIVEKTPYEKNNHEESQHGKTKIKANNNADSGYTTTPLKDNHVDGSQSYQKTNDLSKKAITKTNAVKEISNVRKNHRAL